jgi:HPt (histidine-containing phosphotransfer) domain-containing protein
MNTLKQETGTTDQNIPAPPRSPSVDFSFLEHLERLGGPGSADLVRRIIGLFLKNSPPILAELVAAVEGNRSEEAFRLAHKLRSSCLNIGAIRLSALLSELELDLNSKKSNNALSLLGEIQIEFPRVEEALKKAIE